MPQAAETRSLEDILASIRQSLADETVDGLVQLSAAAAAAARAEVAVEVPPNGHAEAEAEAHVDPQADTLKAKLAGALAAEEDLTSQLTTVLSEATQEPEAEEDEAVAAEIVAEPAPEAAPAGADLSKLWFLRPGAPEEAPAAPSKTPGLSLDALPTRDLAEPPSEKVAAALFSLSARAIVEGGSSPAPAIPARPEPPVTATPDAVAAEAAKRKVPRLDATQIEMINKLRASSAAAVESITSEAEVVDLRKPALPEAVSSPAPAIVSTPAEPVTAEASTERGTDETASEAQAARTEPVEADVGMLLSRPARSTPLFVGPNAQSRPIVSAPPLPVAPLHDAEDAAPETAAAEVEDTVAVVIDEPAVALAAYEPDLEDVLEPTPLVAEPVALVETARVEEMPPPPPVRDTIHTLDTVAAPMPPPAAAPVGMPPTMGGRPLEEMIAAVLEPVMQRLLEKNLGPMIEAMVRREVEKALGKSQDT